MPILNSNQTKTIQDIIDDSFNGKIKYDTAEKELSKLLPEGSDPFKFDRAESNNPSESEISSLVMKNFTKFKQTAPDYTPPSEDFNAFKASVEELSAPAAAAPVHEAAEATEHAPETPTAHQNGPSSADEKRDFKRDQELEYLKSNDPDFYNMVSQRPKEMQEAMMQAWFAARENNIARANGYGKLAA